MKKNQNKQRLLKTTLVIIIFLSIGGTMIQFYYQFNIRQFFLKFLKSNQEILTEKQILSKEEIFIADKNIKDFYILPDKNQILYISTEQTAKTKTFFKWTLYNRQTKEKRDILETNSLPKEIYFSPTSQYFIFYISDWEVISLEGIFLEKKLKITPRLKEVIINLQKENLIPKKVSLEITQISWHPFKNNELIIKTEDALYQLNFITREARLIFSEETSPFYLTNKAIYWLNKDGILIEYSFSENRSVKISEHSFSFKNLNNFQIRAQNNNFILINENQSYFLRKNELPFFIKENIKDGEFSPDNNFLLIINEKEIGIFAKDVGYQMLSFLENSIFPPQINKTITWYRDAEHLIILENNFLKLHKIKTKKEIILTEKIKEPRFYYDAALNYIYYLSDEGIMRINLFTQ